MPDLTLANLSVKIANKSICHGLNIHLPAGSTCAILGPNGVGKTTLLHTLAGLHKDYSGYILAGDLKLSALSTKQRGCYLGILFQKQNHHFTQTVSEYCLTSRYPHSLYFRNNHARDAVMVSKSLAAVDLAHLANKMINQLSGGEQKRLAIAALLTQNPMIYLLDEPTNHLDSRYQIHILRHFQQLVKNEDKIVLLTTHDINLAATYSNYLILLYPNGEVILGHPETVLTENNLSRLYEQPIRQTMAWHPIYHV